MKLLSGTLPALILHASLCAPTRLSATTVHTESQDDAPSVTAAPWQSTKAELVYGFPDLKPNKKGTLTLSADAFTFSGNSGRTSIQRKSVTAVSAGNQRVELWGIGGRILRMTIPDGGGLAAAVIMQHRVDMLTVEFNDGRGGNRAAVFLLPANEAGRALQSFALAPAPPREGSDAACQNAPVEPKSVLVSAPNWDNVEVPAAYRALVYEHVVDRLRRTNGVRHVYRDGEGDGHGACPQYIVHIAITTFKQGSSVQRAFLGPVGMFVGTTQMKLDVTFADALGKLNTSEQITATIRGESESTNVADHVAKSIAKRYAAVLQSPGRSNSAKGTVNPAS
jgi:hypothetical protein